MNIREQYSTLFDRIESQDSALTYVPKFREFGLCILERGLLKRRNVFEQIFFCPFTGKQLPDSLRDVWFEKLEALGLEPESDNIPEDMRTERWWSAASNK